MIAFKKTNSIYVVLLEAVLLLLVLCEAIVFLGAVVSRFAFRSPISVTSWDEHKTWINIFVNTIESYGLLGVFWPVIFYVNVFILAIIMGLGTLIYRQRKEYPFPKRAIVLIVIYVLGWFPAVLGMLAYSM